jgi:hypothetical protein
MHVSGLSGTAGRSDMNFPAPIPIGGGAPVVVGTRVASRPRADPNVQTFPRALPTSGHDGYVPMRSSACDTRARPWVKPALCWPAFHLVALGHRLRNGWLRFVRRLHIYYGEVRILIDYRCRERLPAGVLHHRSSGAFANRPGFAAGWSTRRMARSNPRPFPVRSAAQTSSYRDVIPRFLLARFIHRTLRCDVVSDDEGVGLA